MGRRVPGRRAWTTHRPGSRSARAIRASHRAAPPSRPRSTPSPLDPTFGLIRRRSRARRTNSGRSTRRPARSSVRRAPSTRVHGTARRRSRRSAGVKRGAELGPPHALEEPLLAEFPRHARQGRAGIEAVEEAVEPPARRGADVLERRGRGRRRRRPRRGGARRPAPGGDPSPCPARRGCRPRGTPRRDAGPRCSRRRGAASSTKATPRRRCRPSRRAAACTQRTTRARRSGGSASARASRAVYTRGKTSARRIRTPAAWL